jgi:intein/homing endonuclease
MGNYKPIIKQRGFNPSPIAGNIPAYADSVSDPKCVTTNAYNEFWLEQIDYCINGYRTGGMFIPGRYYYYLNFVPIRGLLKGRQYPWYVDLDYEYFTTVEQVKRDKLPGIIAPKARRKGLSEKAKTILSHGLRFIPQYRGAITAGLETYTNGLRNKFEDIENNIAPELSLNVLKNNEKIYKPGYEVKNELGQFIEEGYGGMISFETMYDDATKLEGEYFHDVIYEESGRYKLLGQVIESIKPALMFGSQVMGTSYIYGCVCAGTKVFTNDGRIVNIENLKQEEGILGYDGKEVSQEPIVWMKPPAKKECYRITTMSGRTLECSHDHPILWGKNGYVLGPRGKKKKGTKFVSAENIKIDDQVAVIDEIPVFGDIETHNPRLLGWFIGDGSYGFDKTPILSTCDKEIYSEIESDYDTTVEKTHITKDGKVYKEIRIKGITKFLRNHEIYGQTKKKKRLPGRIGEFTENALAELLGGLFDADGHVNEKKGGYRITLTSSADEMLKEVQLVLQKFGVHGRILMIQPSKSGKGGTEPYFRMEIRDAKSIVQFRKHISFRVKYKQEKLDFIADYSKSKLKGARSDKVPGLRFERVVSIDKIGSKKIYNLNTGNTHTYIANGIVTHNTGGNILSTSKDFKEYWDEAETLGYVKIWVPGNRMHYPFFGNPIDTKPYKDKAIGKVIDPIKNLRQYEPYQIIGCEDVQSAKEHILELRKVYAKLKNKKKLKEHNQHLPLEIEEAFSSGGSNNFNDELIYEQLFNLEGERSLYKEVVLERVTKKSADGMLEKTMNVRARPATKNDPQWKIIKVYQEPLRKIIDLDVAGIDSYNQDKTQTSSSLGAMVVMRQGNKVNMENNGIHNAEYPVCLYYERPPRKEQFYEICLNIAIWYGLLRNTMCSAEQDFVIDYFKKNGGTKFLSPRPKTYDSKGSKQMHQYGAKMTVSSKPIILGVVQSWVEDFVLFCHFQQILRDMLAYDEEYIGTDWDSVDALALAKMRIEDMRTRPRNRHDADKDDDDVVWYEDSDGNMRVREKESPGSTAEKREALGDDAIGNWVSLSGENEDDERDVEM